MTLRELIDEIEVQGNGIVQMYEDDNMKILYEWEYDLNSLPEEFEDLYVKYMWAEKDKMIIEVSNER